MNRTYNLLIKEAGQILDREKRELLKQTAVFTI